MRRTRTAALAAIALVASAFGLEGLRAAGFTGAATATIEVEPSESGLTVTASALALAPVTVRGEMSIDRRGASGSVVTTHASQLILAAGERGRIGTIELSFAPGDALEVTMTLTYDSMPVATSTLTVTTPPAGE